jgi:hypothetical protein
MNTKKCFIVFNRNADRRVLVEAVDATNAALTAADTYYMKVGDVQEVDCDISEEEFNQITPKEIEKPQASEGVFAENGPDKLLIFAGIAILAFFALAYDVGVNGVANLQKLQNRNIGCAVGLVLAAVGAIRIAIDKKP